MDLWHTPPPELPLPGNELVEQVPPRPPPRATRLPNWLKLPLTPPAPPAPTTTATAESSPDAAIIASATFSGLLRVAQAIVEPGVGR